jgi:maltoporin
MQIIIKTALPGSFNRLSDTMVPGIVLPNGGDNGNTFTWAAAGARFWKYQYVFLYRLNFCFKPFAEIQ